MVRWIALRNRLSKRTKKEQTMPEETEKIHPATEKNLAVARVADGAARVRPALPVDARAIRTRLGMTQAEFARSFGFSMATLRHWERGDRIPQGAARVLLGVIAQNPQAVMESLART
jgi:putative transcriptional regulator